MLNLYGGDGASAFKPECVWNRTANRHTQVGRVVKWCSRFAGTVAVNGPEGNHQREPVQGKVRWGHVQTGPPNRWKVKRPAVQRQVPKRSGAVVVRATLPVWQGTAAMRPVRTAVVIQVTLTCVAPAYKPSATPPVAGCRQVAGVATRVSGCQLQRASPTELG